jgi:hypothetical protein
MLGSSLLGPFADSVARSDAGAAFDAGPWLEQPPLFWREALRRLCHDMGSGLVREKSIGELLKRLRVTRGKAAAGGAKAEGWIALKRENKAFMCGTRLVRRPPMLCHRDSSHAPACVQGIFAPDVFPQQPHFPAGQPLRLGSATAFGPWTVQIDHLDQPLPPIGEPLTLWDVLSGEISYTLPLNQQDADAAASDGEPFAPPAPWLGLRTAVAPRLPPLRGLPRRLRRELPLVVTGEDRDGCEGESESEEEGEGGRARREPTFRVRAWTVEEAARRGCVRVSMRYTRPRRTLAQLNEEGE